MLRSIYDEIIIRVKVSDLKHYTLFNSSSHLFSMSSLSLLICDEAIAIGTSTWYEAPLFDEVGRSISDKDTSMTVVLVMEVWNL